MYFNLTGRVTHLFNNSIVINVNNIGYQLLVSSSKKYNLNEEVTIFTHLVKREDEEYLVGLSSLEEKEAFLTLIKVKGIGPKTALTILSHVNINELYSAISNDDIFYLKRIPGLGNRSANQILLDLKGTIKKRDDSKIKDIRIALHNYGYKYSLIDSTINKININNLSKEQILKEALRLLSI